jgi:hypothetical protein
MTSIEETISILKGLMVACQAVEHACQEPHAKIEQRQKIDELEQAVKRLGGETIHLGLAGTNDLLWAAAAASQRATSDSTRQACEKMQAAAYCRALQADLPLNIRMLVQRQHVELSTVRARIHSWGQAIAVQK